MRDFVFWSAFWIGAFTLIAGPWVHSYQLRQLNRRLGRIERAIEDLYWDPDPDNDPDEEDEAPAQQNVIAMNKAA